MSTLSFTLKFEPQQRVDMSPLKPDALTRRTAASLAATMLQCGNRKLRAGDLFDIAVDSGGDGGIEIRGSCGKLDYIGRNMKKGSISVYGDAGSYLGFGMKNGSITVHGNVDAFAASGMRGGEIAIHGSAGDFLGAAIAGDKQGMNGGQVIVSGNAGDRVGDQMRRGTVLIEGNAGSYCGSRMIAGTIGVLGFAGNYVGYGMRRGRVMLYSEPLSPLHSTFEDNGMHDLLFLNLVYRELRTLPTKFSQVSSNRVRRYVGDIANNGVGEILLLIDEASVHRIPG